MGVDIFIDNPTDISAAELARKIKKSGSPLELIVITSRGLKIWPDSTIDAPYLRHCCCRFQTAREVDKLTTIDHQDIFDLMQLITSTGLDIIKTENLYTYDGQIGYTLASGQ